MASISAKTFVNGSLRRINQAKPAKRFEVDIAGRTYVLVLWRLEINGAYQHRSSIDLGAPKLAIHLPRKMALTFLHAVMREGLLDLNPEDFS